MFFLLSVSIQAETLFISAAASLAPSLKQISQAYQLETPEDKLVFNFASSSILARQIQYGAPADLYFSANKQWIDYLTSKNKLDVASIFSLISNQLVIARNNHKGKLQPDQACYDQESTIEVLKGLASKNEPIVVADLNHVPLGIYSKQALISSGQFQQLEQNRNLIPSANARSALAFIEQEQVNLALLYYSDAINSDKVSISCIIPSDFHAPISYFLAKVRATKKRSETKQRSISAFYQFLQSDLAKSIFVKHGFLEK